MNFAQALWWLLLIAVYAITASYMIYRIVKTTLFTKGQKRINIILIILVPFFWSILVFYILKKEPDYSDKRKRISNDLPPAEQLYWGNNE